MRKLELHYPRLRICYIYEIVLYCPLISRHVLKEPWHGSVFYHWERICGCCILFWNCFLFSADVSILESWCCCNSGFVGNVTCETFTINRTKVLISGIALSRGHVSLIALIQDLLVVVFDYIGHVIWTLRFFPLNIFWSLCDFGKCLSIKRRKVFAEFVLTLFGCGMG